MRSARAWLAGLAAALGLAPALASAQDRIQVGVMVSQISDRSCQADPRASKLDGTLRQQFRYECLEVLESRGLDLALDQVGALELPNGKRLRVRPLHVGDRGVLLAVSVEGTVETDLRVQNRHLVAIGAGQYGDGTLVISLEPTF